MFQPLYIAATGLNSFEDQMIDITNNLSNARTVGFKRGRTEMESLFYLQKTFKDRLGAEMEKIGTEPFSEKPYSSVQFGTGVRIASTPKDFSQGPVEITNNPFDLAIQGEGFFQFQAADGSIVYGRAGNLHVDNEGNLVDPNGHIIDPGIVFPEDTTSVIVRQDGTILITIEGDIDQTEIGQINLARFSNSQGLEAVGQNLFKATAASGEPIVGIPGEEAFGTISQYSLEYSNVDVISEMMRMVMVQRVFDTVSKAVQAYDGMLTSLERMKQ